jgi:hypothetical protein
MVGGGVEPRGSTAVEQIAETIAAALAVLRDSISVDAKEQLATHRDGIRAYRSI